MTFKSRFGPPRQLTITRIGWFYVLLTVGLGAAGINTGNNLVMLTCGVMLGLILASGVLSERCLRGLQVARELPAQLSAHSESLVTFTLRNAKTSPSFSVLASEQALQSSRFLDSAAVGASKRRRRGGEKPANDRSAGERGAGAGPTLLTGEDGSLYRHVSTGRVQFPLIRGGQTERRAYLITPAQRGSLAFGKVKLSTRFPFGLFEKSLMVDLPERVFVAPESTPGALPAPLPRLGAGERGALGEGQGIEPWELRLHREGEDVRRIAWAQSARAGKLLALTREREGLAEVRLHLRANLSPAAHERHLAELRFSAERLLGDGSAVALTAGPQGEVTLVPTGLGTVQLARILQVLAREAGATHVTVHAGKPREALTSSRHLGVPRFLRWQRGLLAAVALSAFAAVAASRELPPWLSASFLVIWGYALGWRERASAGFGKAVNLLSLVLLIVLVAMTMAKIQAVPTSAAEAALLLCANRLLGRRDPSDDALLHLSCFLVLAAGAALGSELWYGLCLVAFCALAATSLTLSELRRGIEDEARAQSSALMAAPELTAPGLLWFTAALGTGALAFALVLFPLFPRAQLGLLQALSYGGGPRVTGVSDRVDLSAGGALQRSSKLVIRLEITDGDPQVLHYFRVVTLDRFTGTGWAPSDRHGTQVHLISLPGAPVVTGLLEPFIGAGDYVPVPEGLTDLRPEVSGVVLRADTQGDLRLVSTQPGGLELRFAAAPERPAGPPTVVSGEAPQPSAAIRALADRLLPAGTTPADAARRLERYFRGFQYALDTAGGSEALDAFLRDKRGDCQLFATATAELLRARGYQARYVAGYYLDSPHRGENLVRAWDAHAWAEVLTPEGVLLVDSTPPSERGGHRVRDDAWQALRDFWDAAEFRWLRTVVDYDQRSQAREARRLLDLGLKLWHPAPRSPLSVPRVLGALAVLLLGASLLRRLRHGRDPAQALERRLFAQLARRGVARSEATTYGDALATLSRTSADLARRSAPLFRRLGEARFGAHPLSPGELRSLRRAIDRLASN